MLCIYLVGRYPAAAWWPLARQTGQSRQGRLDPRRFRLSGLHHTRASLNALLTTTLTTATRSWRAGCRASPANTSTHETRFLFWLLCPVFFFPFFPLLFLHGSAYTFCLLLYWVLSLSTYGVFGWAVHTMKPFWDYCRRRGVTFLDS